MIVEHRVLICSLFLVFEVTTYRRKYRHPETHRCAVNKIIRVHFRCCSIKLTETYHFSTLNDSPTLFLPGQMIRSIP
jgi:hypothetical protein